jgi:hypothetical protein
MEDRIMSPKRELSLSEWFGKKGWIPFRLQSMSSREFITTVNKILRDEHIVIPYERGENDKEPARNA